MARSNIAPEHVPEWTESQLYPAIERKIQLITPMLGGGAELGKVDLKVPVRASAIRGHLRFWWRAQFGSQLESSERLFTEEAKLWGAAAHSTDRNLGPSLVSIEVQVTKRGNRVRLSDPQDYPKYAALGETPEVFSELVFELQVRVHPDYQLIVERTIDLWLLFGGIGARTRRGFGSLSAVGYKPLLTALPQNGSRIQGLTSLHGAKLITGPVFGKHVDAWKTAVEIYQNFRAGESLRDRDQKGEPRWPEANSIRALAAGRDQAISFPKAELGLPIVFHFRDEPKLKTVVLEGQRGKSRFASPVITKASVIDEQIRPLILLLNSPRVAGSTNLKLKISDDRAAAVEPESLDLPEQLKGTFGCEDIRESFIQYAKKHFDELGKQR